MRRADLVVRGRRVVVPEGVGPAAVQIAGGRIARVTELDDPVPSGAEIVEAGDAAVLPGLVDSHVHVNEPGRTHWEGFSTATRAAAAGGITTIVDMPLNSLPPTTTVAALSAKRSAAAGQCWVDVAFWGGLIPDNHEELPGLTAAGVCGFKAFLCPSGVDEYGHVDPPDLEAAMCALAELGVPAIVHAESPAALVDAPPGADGRAYATYLATRPPDAEVQAIHTVVETARRTGCRAHVLHLSAADALGVLTEARAGGVPVTVETCPHYLTLSAEAIPDGATAAKCAPPIRDGANRDRLWEGLADTTIDCIVSDHSPSPADLKGENFLTAWGGIASLQLGLSLVWTAARDHGHDLVDVVRWMSAAPATIAGLPGKGAIAEGRDADLVLFDPDAVITVDPAALAHRHAVSPYDGWMLRGAVLGTWLRGRRIVADGQILEGPAGRLLRKGVA
jgi:allantoinase